MSHASEVVAYFTDLFGTDAVATGAATTPYAVDGQPPHCAVFPSTVDDLCRGIAAADTAGYAMIPVGNGTQLRVGRPPERYDLALSTRRLRRVLAHEAADMTLTVEAGATLTEVNDVLGGAGQWLPLDPPDPATTTIGALIATNASGPLRLSQGTVRDLLIGVRAVLADGTLVKGGGRVVKNVAGYDLMKLFTGSFGTLGVIIEATFKVRPHPEHEATFVIGAPSSAAALALAMELLSAPIAPLYMEVVNPTAAQLLGVEGPGVIVGCGGLAEEIDAQRDCLAERAGGERVRAVADAGALHAALRDFPARRDFIGCRLTALPSKLQEALPGIEAATAHLDVALVMDAGNGIATMRFHDTNDVLPDLADRLHTIAAHCDGRIMFDALPAALKDRIDPWGGRVPGLELMRGIKEALDPRRRLSPGRFVGGI